MHRLPTPFAACAAVIGAAALVAAEPPGLTQRPEPGVAARTLADATGSRSRVVDVARAGVIPPAASEDGPVVFQEPYFGIPPRAPGDPVPWAPPPARRGITSTEALVEAMVALVDADSIDATVFELESFGTRKADLHGTRKVADWIAARFHSFGVDSVFVHSWTRNFTPNVVAIHRGISRPHAVYLIGGHYDTISNSSYGAPGADDNGSGTAAVLECARVLSRYRFDFTLQFGAWSAEEFGLFGSDAYATHITGLDSILGVINVDMIGFRAPGDRRDLDVISNFASDWLRDEAQLAGSRYVPALPVVAGYYPPNANSDQASFWARGYSAISFFEDSESPSPFLHTLDDVMGTSYNDPTLARQSTQVAVALLASLAQPVAVPVLVQDLAAQVVDGRVELEWVLGGDARAIASVGVERAPEATGPWTARTSAPLIAQPRMMFVDPEVPDGLWWYRLALSLSGSMQYAGPIAVETAGTPRRQWLAARDPGAGQPVEIRYNLALPAPDLRLAIFDVRGHRVRLLDVGRRPAGTSLRYWDRRDDAGSRVSRGVYFVLLENGASRTTRKLALVHE